MLPNLPQNCVCVDFEDGGAFVRSAGSSLGRSFLEDGRHGVSSRSSFCRAVRTQHPSELQRHRHAVSRQEFERVARRHSATARHGNADGYGISDGKPDVFAIALGDADMDADTFPLANSNRDASADVDPSAAADTLADSATDLDTDSRADSDSTANAHSKSGAYGQSADADSWNPDSTSWSASANHTRRKTRERGRFRRKPLR